MKKLTTVVAGIGLAMALMGCASSASTSVRPHASRQTGETTEVVEAPAKTTQENASTADKVAEEVSDMKMSINGSEVTVAWEDNQAVRDLRTLVAKGPVTVDMSMYGGFEQVGSLGTTLTSEDKQTTTSAGDIVLYSSNQIVVFYGQNSWAYTRLGHITDRNARQMKELLGNGNVTITIASGSEA